VFRLLQNALKAHLLLHISNSAEVRSLWKTFVEFV